MPRVVLIHWNAAEGGHCAELLRKAGYEVRLCTKVEGPATLRALAADPPEVFVIDLTRSPLQGRVIAVAIRQKKTLRRVPLLFVSGDPEKVARIRETIPDGFFADWTRVKTAVRTAIKNAPADPVVPDTMAGYSGTPLTTKLGVKAGSAVALLGAPGGFLSVLGELPEGARVVTQARGRSDLVLLFVKSQAEMRRRFPAAARLLGERGSIWICWPKKASGVDTDVTEPVVRLFGLDAGFVDYKICAVDRTWSGLLFTRRRKK